MREAAQLARDEDFSALSLIDEYYPRLRQIVSELLETFHFQAAPAERGYTRFCSFSFRARLLPAPFLPVRTPVYFFGPPLLFLPVFLSLLFVVALSFLSFLFCFGFRSRGHRGGRVRGLC